MEYVCIYCVLKERQPSKMADLTIKHAAKWGFSHQQRGSTNK